MANTSPLPVKEGMAAIVVGQGDKSASQIIKKLVVFPYLIAWGCGAYAEPHKKCYPVPTVDCQEFDVPKVEDEFEKKCEMFPHYDGHFIIVWEDYPTYEGDQWDTMANDYWGNTMDVTTILDKKC